MQTSLLRLYSPADWESINKVCDELVKLLLAIILLLDNMQKNTDKQEYNHRQWENYYDPEKVSQRDHPLYYQRMDYILREFNVLTVIDSGLQVMPVKEKMLDQLRLVKGVTEMNDTNPGRTKVNLMIIDESIQKLMRSRDDIRIKIPRVGDFGSNDE